ncbi:putative transmembrane protein [Gregarina niphandrodes]|uniref:Transmembrane protein n=1 Tax=Gregarina niphandrodes TaxID=110365 RepID=A0A023B659_GRENI|nr:putative transmembrane protein [Gregarina niphandrodes]EZG65388.1 putative transmembrane protein [Gregarina niphandrodes]|eukprot:XP_011134087.1 putative transmembrane protein [Gregarina niphandrodes]
MLTFVALLLLICICGILGILLKWTFGLRTIGIGFMILFINCAVTIIVTLMVWFFTMCHVGGAEWDLHGTELYHAWVVLALEFLVVALAWHTISALRSLQWVIAYGGSGWEKLNYKDLRNIYAAEAYLGDFGQ